MWACWAGRKETTPRVVDSTPPGSFFTTSASLPGGVLSTTRGVVSFPPAQHAHIVSASYSVQINNLSPTPARFMTSPAVSYTHLRAHETRHDLVCRLLLEK